MDYEQISREIVRALRGKRSQAACAKRMRCRSNVLYAWESGIRHPALSHVARLVAINGRDLSAAVRSVTDTQSPGARAPAELVRRLAGTRSAVELAHATHRNRNTIARWLSGESEPRLPDFLRLVHVTTLRLVEFVAQLVEPESIPSLRDAFDQLSTQRTLAYDVPWSHAVLRALELAQYRALPVHEHGFLARLLGISRAEERRCIAALARAGQIERRDGRWQSVHVLAVDTSADRTRDVELKAHWAEHALARLEKRGLTPDSLYSYNLFAISDDALAEIRRLHLAYYARVRSIVERCSDPTRLALINVQLVPLTDRLAAPAPLARAREYASLADRPA